MALLRCFTYDTVRGSYSLYIVSCSSFVSGFSNRARAAQPEDAAVVVRGGGGPPRGGAPDGGEPATDALSALST